MTRPSARARPPQPIQPIVYENPRRPELPLEVLALGELRRVSRLGVVVSFADAGTLKSRFRRWRRNARRTIALTVEDLRVEAQGAGLDVERTWRLAGPFSHLGAAVLRPR